MCTGKRLDSFNLHLSLEKKNSSPDSPINFTFSLNRSKLVPQLIKSQKSTAHTIGKNGKKLKLSGLFESEKNVFFFVLLFDLFIFSYKWKIINPLQLFLFLNVPALCKSIRIFEKEKDENTKKKLYGSGASYTLSQYEIVRKTTKMLAKYWMLAFSRHIFRGLSVNLFYRTI